MSGRGIMWERGVRFVCWGRGTHSVGKWVEAYPSVPRLVLSGAVFTV